MKYAAFACTIFFMSPGLIRDAGAVVCARGVYRAGCVGPHGAAVVHRPVAAVRCAWVAGRRVCRSLGRADAMGQLAQPAAGRKLLRSHIHQHAEFA